MSYLGELRTNWRALTAATVGLAGGYSITNYTNNIFAPPLIAEFGWSRSQFALMGLGVLLGVVCQPVAGRLTDAVGVRRMAVTGVVAAPLIFLAMSAMGGSFWHYFALNLLLILLAGSTTSLVIYTRLVAQTFDRARGFALAIAAAAPAMSGAACTPFLSALVDSHGWRAGFVAMAIGCGAAGAAALLLIPDRADRARRAALAPTDRRTGYGAIVRNPAFGLIMGGVFLCTLTLTLQVGQLKLVLQDLGVASAAGSMMISLYAASVIVGRLTTGLAIDRFPPHRVAALALGAPAVGLGMLAAGVTAPGLIALAVAIIGLALGSEADVGGYLITRYFPREVYSSVMGILVGAMSLSGAAGALLLSAMLRGTGDFAPFLALSAVAAVVGSLLFLRLGSVPAAGEAT